MTTHHKPHREPHARAVERQRRLWERQATHYDRQMRFWERVLFDDARAWVCAQATGDVLEVAIGTGLNLPFYDPDARLTGLDLSPAMLEKLTDRLAGDSQTRRPLPIVADTGFTIERQERYKEGIVERLTARKPLNN